MNQTNDNSNGEANTFEAANSGRQMGLVAEFVEFLQYNKKYWMIPLLLILLILGALIALGGTQAALFIYPIM